MSITTFPKILRHVVLCRNAVSYSTSSEQTRNKLCALLRETAQPVAVVTAFMPCSSTNDDRHRARYHGATLSSFTSIAMDPYPLITFSLRNPSRMAQSLKSAHPRLSAHMIINLLSAAQTSTAVKFSRPDLYSEPFLTVPYVLSEEGLPMLSGSLGAVSCKLVSTPLPLHDLELLENKTGGRGEPLATPAENSTTSELFIARVVRVEKLTSEDEEEGSSRTLPLLYHRRGFTSCDTVHRSES